MQNESEVRDWLSSGGSPLPVIGQRMIERAQLEPNCSYRWCIHDLVHGTWHAFNEHARAPASSTRKLYILLAVLLLIEREELALGDSIPVDNDKAGAQTCGGLWLLDRPRVFTVEELLKLMMGLSDNVATFHLVELVGLERLNAMSSVFGLCATRHLSAVPSQALTADHSLDCVNTTTAADLVTALSTLVEGASRRLPASGIYLNPQLCEFGLHCMRAQQDTTAIRSWLNDVDHVGDKHGIGYRNYNNVGYLAPGGSVKIIFSIIVDDLHRMQGSTTAFAHARDFIALFARLLDDCARLE